jgi:hypothetical protein
MHDHVKNHLKNHLNKAKCRQMNKKHVNRQETEDVTIRQYMHAKQKTCHKGRKGRSLSASRSLSTSCTGMASDADGMLSRGNMSCTDMSCGSSTLLSNSSCTFMKQHKLFEDYILSLCDQAKNGMLPEKTTFILSEEDILEQMLEKVMENCPQMVRNKERFMKAVDRIVFAPSSSQILVATGSFV